MKSVCFLLIIASTAITSFYGTRPSSSAAQQSAVLVFSKTAGFRHDSIADGIAAIRLLGQQNGFTVDAVEDSSAFNDANLSRYQAIVFLSTTGDILNADQKAAMQRFIGKGGGFVGIHSASDTEYNWPWYGGLVGAYFQNHPAIQTATIRIEDDSHPSTSSLPAAWSRNDEWYNFRLNPRGRVKVLAKLDETTYSGGSMGADHPIAWCQIYSGGRSWYTAGGHTKESYSEPLFLQHLLGGIQFAAGTKPGACSALAAASSASFKTNALAGDSIASLFGDSLASTTQSAAATPLPTSLAGTSLKVKDGAGKESLAQLFFVSPGQINFLIPPGVNPGQTSLTLIKEDGAEPGGMMQIASVAPGFFSANSNGKGVAAGVILRIKQDGSRSFEPISRFDQSQNRFVPVSIDLSPPNNQFFLILFGTGIRAQSNSTIKLGGISLQVTYAGLQGEFAGLDQVNILLPRDLIGRGEIDVEFNADGLPANIVTVAIQ